MDPLEEIRRQIEASMIIQNTRPIEDFEGFSPADMRYILYEPFSSDSPLKFKNRIPDKILDQIPFLLQIEYLLKRIDAIGEIKLTSTGALPTQLVKEIYSQGFIKDSGIEKGYTKLYGEASCLPVHLTRIIVELAGFVKKKKGKLSLTKIWAEKLRSEKRTEILFKVFTTYSQKFNWSYLDGYQSLRAAQLGFAFSLFLISKYGNIERLSTFYSEKYLKAFPQIIAEFPDRYSKGEGVQDFHRCYLYRTFERFLEYFNIVEVRTEGKFYPERKKHIKKSTIFSEIIDFD
jgi:hypothetical protein